MAYGVMMAQTHSQGPGCSPGPNLEVKHHAIGSYRITCRKYIKGAITAKESLFHHHPSEVKKQNTKIIDNRENRKLDYSLPNSQPSRIKQLLPSTIS
jgi:hypothetical protein